VSQRLVVGIFAGTDGAAIESALSGQQIDLSKVQVLRSASASTPEDESSELNFIDVVESMESNSLADDMTKGMGIMGDAGGTGVPMGRDIGPSLSSFESSGETNNYLSGLSVPDDEVENFNDAIEDGRAVVVYPDAGTDADKIAAAFRAAGLRNVRSY
jgi:rhodanese-related sulfurtransferase